jgi:hypothetical protein
MLVPNETPFYPYPGAKAPIGIYKLEAGKVVQIRAQYEDWYKIDIELYEAANYGDIWVQKKDLAAYDPKQAKEGMLMPGAKVFNEDGSEDIQFWYGERLIVTGDFDVLGKGSLFRITSGAGKNGYIRKSDFLPNPFAGYADPSIFGFNLKVADLNSPAGNPVHLRVTNLNSSSGKDQVQLTVPEGWEWKANPVNDGNGKFHSQYSVTNLWGDNVGEFWTTGRYPQDAYSKDGFLPNHAESRQQIPIRTIFGSGVLHVLISDLDNVQRTAQHTNFKEIYVLIPIKFRNESYCLDLRVPPDEDAQPYIEAAKQILGAK